jgi:salicylate hydroxylase
MITGKIGINGAGIGAWRQPSRCASWAWKWWSTSRRVALCARRCRYQPHAERGARAGRLGIGDALRETAARPTHRISRVWDSGEESSRLAMSDEAERRYGAPHRCTGRPDDGARSRRSRSKREAWPQGHGIILRERGATPQFADGSSDDDVLIGADGIHSVVRRAISATSIRSSPAWSHTARWCRPSGWRACRTSARSPNGGGRSHQPDRDLPLNRGREIFVFATVAQESWRNESWTTPGRCEDLRAAYAGFHPDARALLDACDDVLISALYVRDPAQSAGQIR